MLVAHSGFPDGKLCITGGLMWLGTNDMVVQISFLTVDWTVHLSGAQHPTVKCSCLMIKEVHLNDFLQKCHPMKQAATAGPYSVLSSEEQCKATRIPAPLP